jgi:endoglucanase
MNVELLRKLVEAHGVPSREEAIREIVKAELGKICDIEVDSMGNVHCVKRAKGVKGEAKKLMLAAHMDEIGFMVKFIDDSGFLRIQPLGGWDPRQMASQRVFVHAKGGPLPGVLMSSTKPKHMLTADEAGKPAVIDNFFVDLGLDGKTAKKKISLGDPVTMNRTMQEMGDLLTCKCMDDRVAVFTMIEAVKAAKNHKVDIYAVATVQEEVGLRGAAASGSAIKPDIAVAIDITLANDIPGLPFRRGGVESRRHRCHRRAKLPFGSAISVLGLLLFFYIIFEALTSDQAKPRWYDKYRMYMGGPV